MRKSSLSPEQFSTLIDLCNGCSNPLFEGRDRLVFKDNPSCFYCSDDHFDATKDSKPEMEEEECVVGFLVVVVVVIVVFEATTM